MDRKSLIDTAVGVNENYRSGNADDLEIGFLYGTAEMIVAMTLKPDESYSEVRESIARQIDAEVAKISYALLTPAVVGASNLKEIQMFVLDNSANVDGTHFLFEVIPNPTVDQLQQIFGKPQMSGEIYKGYNCEYHFTGPDGSVITLYDRWNIWRIGGKDMEVAKKFQVWLKEKIDALRL